MSALDALASTGGYGTVFFFDMISDRMLSKDFVSSGGLPAFRHAWRQDSAVSGSSLEK